MSKSYKFNRYGERNREVYLRSERRNSRSKRSPDVDERLNPGYSGNSKKAWNFLLDTESNSDLLEG